MEAYVDEVRKLEEHFDGLQMEHIPRAQNDIADGLSKCAALKLPHFINICFHQWTLVVLVHLADDKL